MANFVVEVRPSNQDLLSHFSTLNDLPHFKRSEQICHLSTTMRYIPNLVFCRMKYIQQLPVYDVQPWKLDAVDATAR
jgi:hypothetical protein